MKLKHTDALRILNIPAQATYADIKKAYRLACKKYHPDRNAAGLEMMKLVNSAYQALSDYVADGNAVDNETDEINLGEELNAALNAVHGLGLTVEICGCWLWISGDTRPHKDILKAANYKWAPVKKMWHFRPSNTKRSFSRGKWSMDQIRGRHGSLYIKEKGYRQLEH